MDGWIDRCFSGGTEGMSTKIGIISEGPIDQVLLPPLLERIAHDRARYDWPVTADDVAEILQIRKKGHGGVLEIVRKLVKVLDGDPLLYDHAFYVILLDRRTQAVQEAIAKLLVNHNRFVLGIALEEIEAWWLADRQTTLAWSGLNGRLPKGCRYSKENYCAEDDDEPKKTLDELTRLSDLPELDRYYGDGSVDLARDFADAYWREFARLDDIRRDCDRGYRPFERHATQQFRSAKRRTGTGDKAGH